MYSLHEKVLRDAEKKELNTNVFGISSLRKYPLNDKIHVQKAIQMFKDCDVKYRKELAYNIYNKAQEYNIEINNNSIIYKYLNNSIKEDIIIENNLLDEALLKNFVTKTFQKVAGSNEDEVNKAVQTAIDLWTIRYKLCDNDNDRSNIRLAAGRELRTVGKFENENKFYGAVKQIQLTSKKMKTDCDLKLSQLSKLQMTASRNKNLIGIGGATKIVKTIGVKTTLNVGSKIAVAGAKNLSMGALKTIGTTLKGISSKAFMPIAGLSFLSSGLKTRSNALNPRIVSQVRRYVKFLESYVEKIEKKDTSS